MTNLAAAEGRQPGVAQLGYLGLAVHDLAAWESFATEILGLAPNGHDGDGALFLRMDTYHHRLILEPGAADDLAFIGWEVADEGALQALTARLEAAGHTVTRATPAEAAARSVVDLVRCADPNGMMTEIFYGPLVTYDRPFVSPRPISGFVTGGLGLGHFTLAVDDLDASLQFYRDVLGMRLSDWVAPMGPGTDFRIAFLHCNPRHHSLALFAAPAPKRLHHFLLQLGALDDIGRTYELVQERNIPIDMTLGRHTNDHMVSFYMRTPSGFSVEYGWGARMVDDRDWQVQLHVATSTWGHRRPKAAAPA